MRFARVALAAVGVLVGLWGLRSILDTANKGESQLNILIWLGGGVIGNDVVIALISLVVGAIVVYLLPKAAKAPATVGLVVIGTITVIAIPFVGRFGENETNPTLLDRDYTTGYLGIVGLVLVCVVIASIFRAVRGARRPCATQTSTHAADGPE